MSLVLLHLSDIHISKPTDQILKRSKEIASTTFEFLPDASCVAIVVSGDIAQAGRHEEYKLAEKFIDAIVRSIKEEKKIPVQLILAPGNHDCDFTGDQEARQAVIDSIPKKSGSIPASYIGSATKVQKAFFEFRRRLENKDILKTNERLWWTYSFSVDSASVSVDVLNASWMSTIREQQGGLVFPFEQFKDLKESGDLRIGVLHHPLNWYNQTNYLEFRSFVHRLEDLILTGHEHRSAGRMIDDEADGQCVFIEGACLQSRSSADSAFNIVVVDLKTRKYKYQSLQFAAARYIPARKVDWTEYRPLPKRGPSEFDLTPEFRRILQDPGATLRHPSGRALVLGDFYVFPDFDEKVEASAKGETKLSQQINSSILLRPQDLSTDIVINGDDEAGKTRLLYRLLEAYHHDGRLPLLLRGDRIRPGQVSDVGSLIRQSVEEQYGAPAINAYLQAPNRQKVILVDDLDRAQLNSGRKNRLLLELKKRADRIILTVGDDFRIRELLGGDDLFEFSEFKEYRLLPLGHSLRHDLIRKWNRIGGVEPQSQDDFHRACDEAEQLIETTKLQYVATTVPIFVLSLLQALSSGVAAEAHNSAFAHYYSFLIVGALESANIPKKDFNIYLSVCNHLSWFIKKSGDDHAISISDFSRFAKEYSLRWTTIEEKRVLATLVESRLMIVDGDSLRFTYPYTYYYFLGKYASTAMADKEVEEYIGYCLKHLYARECANTLLFLAHHTGDSAILNHLISTIDGHYAGVRPVSLSGEDVSSIASLLALAPSVEYQDKKPDEFRKARAERKDRAPNSDGLVNKPHDGDMNAFDRILSVLKAIEIAGILLTHQFPNYSRPIKETAVESIFGGAMRAIKDLYGQFSNVDDLVRPVLGRLRSKLDGAGSEEAEQVIRYAIAFMLRMVTTSFVMKAGAAVKSSDLSENVQAVVTANPTPAYRLIQLGQILQRPGRLPRSSLGRLIREESSNPAVMGVLQLLILHRLYMFDTDHDDKDWALSLFKLGGQRRNVEMNRTGKYPVVRKLGK